MIRILVCDDEIVTVKGLKKILERDGYIVYTASDGREALDIINEEEINVLITDIKLPFMDGFELLEKVRKKYPEIKVIMITAFYNIKDAVHAIKKGASDYIIKPISVPDLKDSIRAVLKEATIEKPVSQDFDLSNISEDDFSSLIRALDNPIRREIIYYIYTHGERSFSSIKNFIKIREPSTLSFHLRNLKAFGLVTQNKDRNYILTDLGKIAANLIKSFM